MKPDALSIYHAISPGAILGGYRVVAPLSKGGMGSVFIAEHQKTGHTRALKVMHPSLADNPKAVQRFEQEAKVGARMAAGSCTAPRADDAACTI